MDLEFSFGTHITSPEEKMANITLADLFSMIRQPDSTLATQQAILRNVLNIDTQKYRNLKKSLPYVVCGKFVTGRRTLEDFASTTSFVIDLDHYENHGKTLDELKADLAEDHRVALVFTSPSGTGLKIFFVLDKPCTDANVYASFYRQFAMQFAQEYGITRYVDYKTNDVTRACFLAHDPDCRMNVAPKTVSIEKYVRLDNVDLFFKAEKQTDSVCQSLSSGEESDSEGPKPIDPNKDTLLRIKSILDTNKRKRIKTEDTMIQPPAEIRNILDGLKSTIEETGVEMYETKGIQCGVKLLLRTTLLTAELNVFYGKKGYSVVHSPKKGTSQQLGTMMRELVSDYLYDLTA